jgi:ribonuclease R
LVLGHLADKKDEIFNGIITGVTDFGIFVQSPKFLVEGLIRLQDLGDDWWHVAGEQGKVRGEMSGKVYKVGDILPVRIERVDIPRRRLDLALKDAPKRAAVAATSSRETRSPGKFRSTTAPHRKRRRFTRYRKK